MNLFFDPVSNEPNYQFQRWPSTLSRPHSSLPPKNFMNEMFQLGIDNRNQVQRPDSSSLVKRIIKHHVHIPTGSSSPPPPLPFTQPTSSPEPNPIVHRSSSRPIIHSRLYRSSPIRVKSTDLTIPISKTKEETSLQNFPKQTHEKRKISHERKRRKQQAQFLADKYAETDTWFQLRRSLTELKRLATTQDILIDPSTSFFNCDGQSFTTLKQVINEQQEEKKVETLKSESGVSSSFGSGPSSHDLNRGSLTTSQSSFSRPRTAKRSIETYSRLIFEPLIVASKPIHHLLLNDNNNNNNNPFLKSRTKPLLSAPSHRLLTTTPMSEGKRDQLLLSDLSNDDNHRILSTPSPQMAKIERETSSRKMITPSATRLRAPSSFQLTSTIKLKPQPLRCHSATDIKSPYSTNKHHLRFILIADEEHRIESWYHQYPFIHSDDLLASFQSEQKSPISAFFIDDLQSSNPNITAKTFLQGKPFHINNDWKKYDLIFISNNIYEQIINYLQTIINLIKLSGKIIQIYQIHHQEDLKKQVKNICKQLQQTNI